MRVNYLEDVESYQGKARKGEEKSRIYARRSDTGATYAYFRRKRNTPDSAAQIAVKEKFKQASAATSAVMADPVQLSSYVPLFKKQKKHKTLRGFVFAQEHAKL